MLNQLPLPNSLKTGWPWHKESNIIYNTDTKWPKISIVTPSFNQGKFIEETIRSVLLQNYPNLEYIIIDGGSTDETVAIIKRYAQWISCWVSEPDEGQSDAINKGIKKCTGEIFNWLNSDDWYMPGALYEVANAFIADRKLQIVSGHENHIGLNGEILFHEGTFLTSSLEKTIELCEVAQPSTFFKFNAIKEIGGVSEDLHYIMDGEIWVKLLLLCGQDKFKKIQQVLVNFRLHEKSKTTSNTIVNNFLFERSSIIIDLQRFTGVPENIIKYYIEEVYKSPKIYPLNRAWKINECIISKRKLRIYFIQKFVLKQFIEKKTGQAYGGMKKLIKERAFDLFLLKSFAKLMIISLRYE